MLVDPDPDEEELERRQWHPDHHAPASACAHLVLQAVS